MINGTIKRFLSENALQLIGEIVTVVVLLLALYITARLAPLSENLAIITTEVQALQENKQLEDTEDVHHAELNQLINRIDHISSRVDQIYSLIIK